MKYLIIFFALLFCNFSFANCSIVKEFNSKLNMSFDKVIGNYDCVLKDVMKDDSMIAGYWIEEKTKTMYLVINNIRAGRMIDLEFYGFDNKYVSSLKSRIDNLDHIKLLERYSFNGAEKPQIEKNLAKEGWRR